MSHSSDRYETLEGIMEEYARRQRLGESPSIEEYVNNYPDLAEDIRELFPAVCVIEDAFPGKEELSPSPPENEGSRREAGQIAGYRIVREIGRGGMGVVYEAEQESLGRRVALKVMSHQFSSDPSAVKRFEREARAAAKLHHTNIVPVFDVDREGEQPFFAMQLIHGQGLDLVIAELRKLKRFSASAESTPDERNDAKQDDDANGLAASLVTGAFRTDEEEARSEKRQDQLDAPEEGSAYCETETLVLAAGTTVRAALPDQSAVSESARDGSAFYRSVAKIGLQVADALAYAHERCIVHRDIKPHNLILDSSGVVWIADFGLAKTDEGNLTQAGDLLGTLRYMSPERFEGKCDSRADIYALGLTLYELLACQPAFAATDRAELIQQVTADEPPSIRRLDPRAPRDLETIILKCMAKKPQNRYANAESLADDLRRFLDGEPIRARRVSVFERAARWGQRNPSLAVAGSLILLLSFAVLAGAGVHVNRIVVERARMARELYRFQVIEAFNALQSGDFNSFESSLFQLIPEDGGEVDHRGFEWQFLWQRYLDAKAYVPLEFASAVETFDLHPKHSELAAVGLSDGTIVLVNLEARTRSTIYQPTQDVHHSPALIQFSPDGVHLFVAGEIGKEVVVRKWHLADLAMSQFSVRKLSSVQSNVGNYKRFQVSPDGSKLALLGKKRLAVLDAETGHEVWSHLIARHDGDRQFLASLEFSLDSRLLSFRSVYQEDVLLFDATDGSTFQRLKIRDRSGRVQFYGHNRLVVSTKSESIYFEQIKEKFVRLDTARRAGAFAVPVPGARLMLNQAHYQAPYEFWDRDGLRSMRCLLQIQGRDPKFAAGGQWLVLAGGTALYVYEWKDIEPRLWQHYPNWYPAVAVSSSGRWVAMPGDLHEVLLFDVETGNTRTLEITERGVEHQNRIHALAVSEDGEFVAAGMQGGAVFLWDLNPGGGTTTLKKFGSSLVHDNTEDALIFLENPTRLLAKGTAEREFLCWTLQSGQAFENTPITLDDTHGKHTLRALDFAYSPKRNLLAVGYGFPNGREEALSIWRLQGNQALLHDRQEAVRSPAFSVEFSPDESQLLHIGRGEGGYHITIQPLDGGKPISEPIPWTTIARFSPSADRIVTAAPIVEEIRIRDSKSLETTGRFAMGETVRRLEFLGGRNAFVTTCSEGITRLWTFTPTAEMPEDVQEARKMAVKNPVELIEYSAADFFMTLGYQDGTELN